MLCLAPARTSRPLLAPRPALLNCPLAFDLTFDRDTELTGYMKLKLWVSPEDADDMDLIVAIKKLDAAGEEVYFYGTGMSAYVKGVVARGWLRVSQRELDEKKSTPLAALLGS